MSTLRAVYHLARADFLERVRRYSFLVILGAVVFLGYQVAIGNLTLELGQYRGEYNSAWVGAMMSLIASFFLGWFGFYLVKGSVARDRETGVGQIVATTPLTRLTYLMGKWLSNFAVLMAMVVVLALAGIVIQFLQGENTQLDLGIFLAPFFFITMPLMALVASIAVLFETIPFLKNGFGNIAYFFLFMISLPLFAQNNTLNKYPGYEPMGLALLEDEMSKAVSAIYPAYNGGFTLNASGIVDAANTFTWNGILWTADLIFARLSLIVLAIAFTSFAALFFDRFDSSSGKPKRRKNRASLPKPQLASTSQTLSQPSQLTPLAASPNSNTFARVLVSEIKLLIKGQPWWWYAIAGGLMIASLLNTSKLAHEVILPIAWVWPILLWSSIGNRENKHHVQQMTFSSPVPVWRQIPAQWLAGFILTIAIAAGAIFRIGLDGDLLRLSALLSGAIFIPSLALACGVWSGGSKLFEIIYILIWYFGPLNRIPALDYIGVTADRTPFAFLSAAILLVAFAIYGRARQVRS
jgi:ABC-type transport system involved in multi-copper enzyme maturation permease subunit